jgi:glutamate:GABA antiporter
MSGAATAMQPPRVLGGRDVVLLYAIAIVSLQWLSTAAQMGPSSLVLWVLAVLVFFVPSGLAVMEMSSRHPGDGGLYLWVKHALGDAHGFVAGWCYVVANLVFFPTLLLFIAGTTSQVASAAWPGLKASVPFNAALSLSVLWLLIGVNVIGLKLTKRVTNGCALLMGAVLAILVLTALVSAYRHGSASDFAGQLLPDARDPALIKSFATMMFALVGLELAPLMGSEIRDPRRVIPRAIVGAGALIIAFYLLGTAALLIALPKERIDSIAGITDAVGAMAERLGAPALGAPVALLMALASVGVLAAWLAGMARLPYAVGIDRHLPAALGRLHPRWRTPHVALLSSGAITTLLVLLALGGSSVGNAYQILVDLTVVLTFIPIAYMFLALPVLRAKHVHDGPGVQRVAGGRVGLALVSGLGLASTLLAIGCALVPPAGAEVASYYAKVLGGCAVFLSLGWALFRANARRTIDAD